MKLSFVGACLVLILQALPVPKGSIEGQVVRAGTGEPIPGARLTLGRVTALASVRSSVGPFTSISTDPSVFMSDSQSAVADGQGKYLFRDLEPGAYRITAGANGYAKQQYGQRTAGGGGTSINVNAGQAVRDAAITLTAAGSVSGRIRDNSGQPAVAVQVQILRAVYNANGGKTYQTAGSARTDDRGEYRLYWITPGRYYLLATGGSNYVIGLNVGSPNEMPGDAIAPTFYPSTGDIAQAAIIDLKPGADLGGVDVYVARQSMYRIRGRVIDGRTGQTPASATITLVTNPLPSSNTNTSSSQSYNSQDGAFELRDVSPGPHAIRAQLSVSMNTVTPGNSGTVSAIGGATVFVNVASDMDGLVLTLAGVSSISGRIMTEGEGVQGSPRVQLRPSLDGIVTPGIGGPTPVTQSTNADGTFRIDTVLPGEYRIAVTPLPDDVYLKQARLNQTDILNKPLQFSASDSGTLEIVLSNRGGQIEGTVTDERQRGAPGIQAVLIPDRQRDRIELFKTATTDANGRFTIRGIPPGDYRLYAWEAIDPFAYFDPDFIKQHETKGRPMHVSESSKETASVRMIPTEP